MAYSINPYLPKTRAAAMRLLVIDQLPLAVVARKCGVHRSTIWRWKRKWDEINKNVRLDNAYRPSRQVVTKSGISGFRLAACRWQIPTDSSRPHTSPTAIAESVVELVLYARDQLKRCAEVVWHCVTTCGVVMADGTRRKAQLSLSSVRRILRRHHCCDGARKPRVKRDNPKRPLPTRPGELVQVDTIHHVDPYSGRRLYYYTVIDLYSRAAYAEAYPTLRPGLAASVVLRAQQQWQRYGFDTIAMVQADNGPEFGRYFAQRLVNAHIQVRHSRLGRPNDNAHIERFNRTLQEECAGHYWRRSVPLHRQRENLSRYIDFYNNERIHLGIQLRTPREMLQRW